MHASRTPASPNGLAAACVAFALVLLPAGNADAGRFFKCTDASGSTVLSQFPCAESADTQATAVAEGNAQYARSAVTNAAVVDDQAGSVAEPVEVVTEQPAAEKTLEQIVSAEPTPPAQDSQEVVELSEAELAPSRSGTTPLVERAASAQKP